MHEYLAQGMGREIVTELVVCKIYCKVGVKASKGNTLAGFAHTVSQISRSFGCQGYGPPLAEGSTVGRFVHHRAEQPTMLHHVEQPTMLHQTLAVAEEPPLVNSFVDMLAEPFVYASNLVGGFSETGDGIDWVSHLFQPDENDFYY